MITASTRLTAVVAGLGILPDAHPRAVPSNPHRGQSSPATLPPTGSACRAIPSAPGTGSTGSKKRRSVSSPSHRTALTDPRSPIAHPATGRRGAKIRFAQRVNAPVVLVGAIAPRPGASRPETKSSTAGSRMSPVGFGAARGASSARARPAQVLPTVTAATARNASSGANGESRSPRRGLTCRWRLRTSAGGRPGRCTPAAGGERAGHGVDLRRLGASGSAQPPAPEQANRGGRRPRARATEPQPVLPGSPPARPAPAAHFSLPSAGCLCSVTPDAWNSPSTPVPPA